MKHAAKNAAKPAMLISKTTPSEPKNTAILSDTSVGRPDARSRAEEADARTNAGTENTTKRIPKPGAIAMTPKQTAASVTNKKSVLKPNVWLAGARGNGGGNARVAARSASLVVLPQSGQRGPA
jgi:hypothetical protein